MADSCKNTKMPFTNPGTSHPIGPTDSVSRAMKGHRSPAKHLQHCFSHRRVPTPRGLGKPEPRCWTGRPPQGLHMPLSLIVTRTNCAQLLTEHFRHIIRCDPTSSSVWSGGWLFALTAEALRPTEAQVWSRLGSAT